VEHWPAGKEKAESGKQKAESLSGVFRSFTEDNEGNEEQTWSLGFEV